MNQLQLQHLLRTRKELSKAKKENDRARAHATKYRGVLYSNDHVAHETHGEFSYRGLKYTK